MSDRTEEGREATETLIHYGVKGMKWGVRKNRSRVEVSRRRVTGSLKTKGGEGRKPSADAKRAKVYGQISKRSGRQALSNAQLKAYIERMNLEQQASRLERNSSVTKFIEELLKSK